MLRLWQSIRLQNAAVFRDGALIILMSVWWGCVCVSVHMCVRVCVCVCVHAYNCS